MMTRLPVRISTAFAFAFVSAVSLAANAQTAPVPAPAPAKAAPGCPPGSWFCADANGAATAAPASGASGASGAGGASAASGAGTGAGVTLSNEQPANEARPAPAPPPRVPPPVVIYQPTPRVAYEPPRPRRYIYTPRPAKPHAEWGLNLHLGGAFMGNGAANGAHMEGGGAGLRFRPVPAYALEADLDFYGGRDYNDFQRAETSFMLNNLIFLNPHSRFQVYLLAGFGWSAAHLSDVPISTDFSGSTDYTYFGGQAGAGVEWRLSKHIALNLDFRGFIRARIDDDARDHPEFVSADGRTSNTSDGALLTGGITFYF